MFGKGERVERSSKGAIAKLSFILLLILPLMASTQEDGWPASVGGKAVVSVNGSPAIEGEMIIRYEDGTPNRRKNEILATLGATLMHRFTIIDADAVELASSASVASALPTSESLPGVQYTEANYVFKAAGSKTDDGDPLLPRQLSYHLIQAPLALKAAGRIKGKPVVVAVLDGGVDYTHPDLKDSMWINEAEKNGVSGVDDDGNGWVDDIYGIDTTNDDGDPMDVNGHGTFIAGIIAASGGNDEGIRGIYPGARIMALGMAGSGGWGDSTRTYECMEYAIEKKACVANLSFTGPSGMMIKDIINKYDGLFVLIAGNSGVDVEESDGFLVHMDYSHVIALASSDYIGNLWSYSCYGNEHVELAAPNPTYSTEWGGSYDYWSGTSFSAPQFCGAAALVKSVHPGLNRLEIIDLILATVDQFPAMKDKLVTGGQLNVARAVMGRSAGGSIVESNWQMIDKKGPSSRIYTDVVYDSGRDRLVLFGGDTNSGKRYFNDTWEWNCTKWKRVSRSGPSKRCSHAMAYDSRRGVTVLYGGLPKNETKGSTWEWDGTQWTEIITENSPGEKFEHRMVYDSARGVVVLFGGNVFSKYSDQTWLYDGTNWVLSDADGPTARNNHSMCYDSTRKVVVLYSGRNKQSEILDDLWEWNGRSWKQIKPDYSVYRSSQSMVYDPVEKRSIMYGGSSDNSQLKLLDTWSWDGKEWEQISNNGPYLIGGEGLAWDDANSRVLAVGRTDESAKKLETWSFSHAGEPFWLDNLIVGSSDFDGDGADDIACWDPTEGELSIRGGGTISIGKRGDIPCPGDYNGDGKAEFATFRPFAGKWYFEDKTVSHGTFGDIPVPGDYDGDGSDEIGVYRPSDGTWRIEGQSLVKFGTSVEVPVPADYDGDGITDLALFNPHTGLWRIRGGEEVVFGQFGDSPVPADYDGDGKADIAVYRVKRSKWFVRNGSKKKFGKRYDIPVPGDYDGDGRAEFATFRPKTGRWYIYGKPSVAHGRVGHVPLVRGR